MINIGHLGALDFLTKENYTWHHLRAKMGAVINGNFQKLRMAGPLILIKEPVLMKITLNKM